MRAGKMDKWIDGALASWTAPALRHFLPTLVFRKPRSAGAVQSLVVWRSWFTRQAECSTFSADF